MPMTRCCAAGGIHCRRWLCAGLGRRHERHDHAHGVGRVRLEVGPPADLHMALDTAPRGLPKHGDVDPHQFTAHADRWCMLR
eukprot:1500040-Heterocapsa_arctica.AAC.1